MCVLLAWLCVCVMSTNTTKQNFKKYKCSGCNFISTVKGSLYKHLEVYPGHKHQPQESPSRCHPHHSFLITGSVAVACPSNAMLSIAASSQSTSSPSHTNQDETEQQGQRTQQGYKSVLTHFASSAFLNSPHPTTMPLPNFESSDDEQEH